MSKDSKKPTLYLIGGPNGSGKTTFAAQYIPTEAKCRKFLNSDEIAKGLSPFDSGSAQLHAGRILLDILKRYIAAGESFALESYKRVQQRVKEGGHQVSRADVFRRYPRIMANLFDEYLPLADCWYFWNSEKLPLALVAHSTTTSIEQLQKSEYQRP